MNNINKILIGFVVVGMVITIVGSYLKVNSNYEAHFILASGVIFTGITKIALIAYNFSRIKILFK